MNKNDLIKQQSDLRAAMQKAHEEALKGVEGAATRFNELLTKFQDIDKQLAGIAEADERAAKLAELEARAEAPQGRVSAPAGATQNPSEVRATKEYERNFEKHIRGRGLESRGLSLYSDSDGGYTLAPSRIEQEIIAPVKNVTVVKSLAKYDVIDGVLSSQGVNLTSVTGNSQKGVVVDLDTESTTGEAFGFSQRRMMSHPFTHWFAMPNALADFSGIDILNYLINEVKERKDVQDDYRFWYGTGVEEPLGLLVDHADGIPASTRDTVVCTSGVVTYAKMLTAYMALKPQHRFNGTWVLCTTAIKQLMALVDDQNRPLETLGLTRGDMPSLFGRPVIECNNIAPTLSSGDFANSQYIGILGNFKRYAIMESKRVSVKLDPYVRSYQDKTIVYFRTWMDGMPQQAEAFSRLISS